MSSANSSRYRSEYPTRQLAAAGLALLCACGNYSNDDLAFLSAIPSAAQLRVVLPKGQGQPLCALGAATTAANAQTQGQGINQGIDGLLSFIDLVRAVAPTTRDGERRSWGPWQDQQHPDVQYLISMVRTRGQTPASDSFSYALAGTRSGGAQLIVLSGEFLGSQAKHGTGTIRLDFNGAWALGTAKPTDPHGVMQVAYTLSSDPRTTELQIDAAGAFGLSAQYQYKWAGYQDGRAIFDFRFADSDGSVYTVDARFAATGAGRANLTGQRGIFSAVIDECFDNLGCLDWLSDPNSFTPACAGKPFCTLGSESACPAGLP